MIAGILFGLFVLWILYRTIFKPDCGMAELW